MFKVNRAISYQPEGKPLEWFNPGDTADLSDWPADDVKRFVAEGIVEKIADPAPLKPPRKSADKDAGNAI
jgi:hypothetical protein